MTIFGCELRRPSFSELTVATAAGVALWLTLVLLGFVTLESTSADGMLVAIIWGCISNTLGINANKGWRPILLIVVGCVLVLLIYQFVCALL